MMPKTRTSPISPLVRRLTLHAIIGLSLALLVPIVLAQVQVLVVTEAYGPAAAIIEARGLRKSPLAGGGSTGNISEDFKPDLPDFTGMSQLERDAFILQSTRETRSPWSSAGIPDPRMAIVDPESTFAWVVVRNDPPSPGRSMQTGRAVWWFEEPEEDGGDDR